MTESLMLNDGEFEKAESVLLTIELLNSVNQSQYEPLNLLLQLIALVFTPVERTLPSLLKSQKGSSTTKTQLFAEWLAWEKESKLQPKI